LLASNKNFHKIFPITRAEVSARVIQNRATIGATFWITFRHIWCLP